MWSRSEVWVAWVVKGSLGEYKGSPSRPHAKGPCNNPKNILDVFRPARMEFQLF